MEKVRSRRKLEEAYGEVRLWHGKFRVRILEKTNGHCLVEALEDYKGVKKGERFTTRIMVLERLVRGDRES